MSSDSCTDGLPVTTVLQPFASCAETVAKTGMILLAGEVTSRAIVDYQKVVRETIRQIGYDDSCKGMAVFLFFLLVLIQ